MATIPDSVRATRAFQSSLQEPRVKVRAAGSSGLGVFAARSIAAARSPSDVLDAYDGFVGPANRAGDYVVEVAAMGSRKAFSVDARDPNRSNWTRYINSVRPRDGRTPNVEFVPSIIRRELFVRVTRSILQGEELLLDYGPHYHWR